MLSVKRTKLASLVCSFYSYLFFLKHRPQSLKYRIAGKFVVHYIWRISRWKIFSDFNFGDDLPVGLASRLSSCTYIKYRYRYACAATKGWRVFNNLTTLTQIRQTAKINSSPNFPAIRYVHLAFSGLGSCPM